MLVIDTQCISKVYAKPDTIWTCEIGAFSLTARQSYMWFCKQFKVSVRQAAELNNMSICGELAVVPKLRLRCLLVACV